MATLGIRLIPTGLVVSRQLAAELADLGILKKALQPEVSVQAAFVSVILAGLFAWGTFLATFLPLYLGPAQWHATLSVIEKPPGFSVPESSSQPFEGGLVQVFCRPLPKSGVSGATAFRCTAKDGHPGLAVAVLESAGATVDPLIEGFGASPVLGSYFHAGLLLCVSAVLLLIWARSWRVSLGQELRLTWDLLAKKPWHLLFPFTTAATATVLIHALFGHSPPEIGAIQIEPATFVFALLVAPAFEELVFRGVVYDVLQARFRWAIVACIGSIWFTVMHTMQTGSAQGFAVLFATSVCFYWLRKTSGSLLVCVLAHLVANALIILQTMRISSAAGT
jgi:membrane protease YdiL (CAAX protease family)